MNTDGALQRLLSLKVRDAMSTHVVHVSANETMEAAAAAMVKHSITGAPVIDEQGACIGVLSAFDFVKREARYKASTGDLDFATHNVARESPDSPRELTEVNDALVSSNMSKGIQAISADASLLEAAREMCAEHIHRLPVLNKAGHPTGLISSLDIVAAMLGAVDEQVEIPS